MMFYYQSLALEVFPQKLIAFSKNGLFNDKKKQFSFLDLASAVFQDNSDKMSQWVKIIENLPDDHEKIILLALS